jgi:hypothetical protein
MPFNDRGLTGRAKIMVAGQAILARPDNFPHTSPEPTVWPDLKQRDILTFTRDFPDYFMPRNEGYEVIPTRF